MTQSAAIVDQLQDVKTDCATLPWGARSIEVNYVKTRNNLAFGRVMDIAAAMADVKLDKASKDEKQALSKAMSRLLDALKLLNDRFLDDAVAKVSHHIPAYPQ